MNLPFTTDQFLNVFASYNKAIWPFQIVLGLLALVAVYFAVKPSGRSNQYISLILSFFWFWIGIVYHLGYFTSINKAAYAFGVLNMMQGGVFFYFGFLKPALMFRFRPDIYGVTGGALILYSLLVYPILGYLLGHVYPQSPTFGLPCPTTIFTFGILLWTDKRVPLPALAIPFVWSVIGFTAAANLGIKEDIGLLVAGLAAASLLVARNRNARNSGPEA